MINKKIKKGMVGGANLLLSSLFLSTAPLEIYAQESTDQSSPVENSSDISSIKKTEKTSEVSPTQEAPKKGSNKNTTSDEVPGTPEQMPRMASRQPYLMMPAIPLPAKETAKLFDFTEENEKIYDGTASLPAYFKLSVDTTTVKLPEDWRLTEDEFVYIAMKDYIDVSGDATEIGEYTLTPNEKFKEAIKSNNPNLDISELDQLKGTLKVLPQNLVPGAIEVMDMSKTQDNNPEIDPKEFAVKVMKGITVPTTWKLKSEVVDLKNREIFSVPVSEIEVNWPQKADTYPISLKPEVINQISDANKNYNFNENAILSGKFDIRADMVFEPNNSNFEIGKDQFNSLLIDVKTIRGMKGPEDWGTSSGNNQQAGVYFHVPISSFEVTKEQLSKEGEIEVHFKQKVIEELKRLNPDVTLVDDISFGTAKITIAKVSEMKRKITQANYGTFVEGKFASFRSGYSMVLGGVMKLGISLAGFKLGHEIGGIKQLFVLPKGLTVGHVNENQSVDISSDPIADLTKQIEDSFVKSKYPYNGLHIKRMPNYGDREAFLIWLDEGQGIDTLVADHVVVNLVSDGTTVVKDGTIGPITGHRDYGVLYAVQEMSSDYILDQGNYPNTSEIASYYGFVTAQLMNETYDNFTTKYSITEVIVKQTFKLKTNSYPKIDLLSDKIFETEGPVGSPYDLASLVPRTIEKDGKTYVLDEKSLANNNKIPPLQGGNISQGTHVTLPQPTEIFYKMVLDEKGSLEKIILKDEKLPETYQMTFSPLLKFLGKVPEDWEKISDGTYAVPKELMDLSEVKKEVGTYSYRMNEKGLALLAELNGDYLLSSQYLVGGTITREVPGEEEKPEEPPFENVIPLTGSKSSVALLGLLTVTILTTFSYSFKKLFSKDDSFLDDFKR